MKRTIPVLLIVGLSTGLRWVKRQRQAYRSVYPGSVISKRKDSIK